MPVCDPDGHVLGVVSESDVVWKELRPVSGSRSLVERLLDSAYGDDERAKATTAGEAMSAPALSIEPDASVARAARLMIEYMVNRLPVVEDGQLVGIVARSDVVRAFCRSDEEIEREVRAELRELWIDPQGVRITVDDGDVALAGEVENRSTALSLERRVRRLPGVASVASTLRWVVDDRSRRTAAAASRLARKV
jgi:CBS-domain-containing membrane protein